jgi:hypothetical protein
MEIIDTGEERGLDWWEKNRSRKKNRGQAGIKVMLFKKYNFDYAIWKKVKCE